MWPHTAKMIISIWRNLWFFSACKKSTSFFTFLKILQTCYFWYFGQAWLHTSKMILPPWRKPSYLSGGKKIQTTSSSMFFILVLQNMQISYFRYFGHAWLDTPNMIKSTSRKFRYFSICQKNTSSLRYYILKNPAIWLVNIISVHNSRTRIFLDM